MAVGAAGFVYFASTAVETRKFDLAVPPRVLTKAADPEAGAHLARIAGCTNCHGPDLTGREAREARRFVRMHSSNLTLLNGRWSDDDLDRAIRRGVRPDGTSVRLMPSSQYSKLTDDDAAALIAYLRTFAPDGEPHQPPQTTWLGRLLVATGRVSPEAETVEETRALAPLDLGPATAEGRYLASIACGGCHGPELTGRDRIAFVAPDLRVVAAYALEDFRTFMRTGIAAGGRRLPVMSNEAVKNTTHLTDAEIDALFAYLLTRAGVSS
jgi:cytochrome c553